MNAIALTKGKILCQIINPSDPYTLRTDDFIVAAVIIGILGRGQLGLTSADGEHSSPVLFGWFKWLDEQGIGDMADYVDAHWEEMCDILDSVMIGGISEREDAESVARRIPEHELADWLRERHDHHRSSMNDIGSAAAALAKLVRATHQPA